MRNRLSLWFNDYLQVRIFLIDTLSFVPYVRTPSQDDLASLQKAPSSVAGSHTLTRMHINGNPSSSLPSTSCVQTLLSRTSGGKRVRYKCTRIDASCVGATHCTYVCAYVRLEFTPLFAGRKGMPRGIPGWLSSRCERVGACERVRFSKQNEIYNESGAVNGFLSFSRKRVFLIFHCIHYVFHCIQRDIKIIGKNQNR